LILFLMKPTKRTSFLDMNSFYKNFIGGTHRFIPLMFSFFIAIFGYSISFAQWWEPQDTAVFVFGGDVMLARNVGKILDTAGVDYPFAGIRDYLCKADCAVVNLESIVGTQSKHADKKYVFQANPAALSGLLCAGVDAVSLANNHIFDNFSAGITECLDSIRRSGIIPLGAGNNSDEFFAPRSFWFDGYWFSIIGLNDTRAGFWELDKPGCAITWTDWAESTAINRIATMNSLGATVIVFEHWGVEYDEEPCQRQIELAHRFIDAGARVVIGSHPHRLQGIEFYRSGVIAYSLGNLIFDQRDSLGNIGALLELTFVDGYPDMVRILPTEMLTNFAQPQPVLPDSFLEYFKNMSKSFGTNVRVEGNYFIFEPKK